MEQDLSIGNRPVAIVGDDPASTTSRVLLRRLDPDIVRLAGKTLQYLGVALGAKQAEEVAVNSESKDDLDNAEAVAKQADEDAMRSESEDDKDKGEFVAEQADEDANKSESKNEDALDAKRLTEGNRRLTTVNNAGSVCTLE